MAMLKKLWQNELFRCGCFVLIGVAIGAIFYPTKRIEEKLYKEHQKELTQAKEQYQKEVFNEREQVSKLKEELSSLKLEYSIKVVKLESQIKELNSKQKTSYYKIVRPDGTIEEKRFTESEVNESTKVVAKIQSEFKAKIDSIEQKWSSIHKERLSLIKKEFDSKEQSYLKEIDVLKKSKVTEVNKKHFSAEVGVDYKLRYYGHVTGDLFGPVFMGVHAGGLSFTYPSDTDLSAGVGFGIKF